MIRFNSHSREEFLINLVSFPGTYHRQYRIEAIRFCTGLGATIQRRIVGVANYKNWRISPESFYIHS